MLKLLIDTSVWLDVAKEYNRQPVLGVLEELIRQKKISLILPQTVVEEFERNKTRIIEESGRSLSGVLKRAKEAVDALGDKHKKHIALEQLNDVDYMIPTLADTASNKLERIKKLFATTKVITRSDEVKLRAAQRAIEKKAPFHRQRNSIEDAILIETYADQIANRKAGERLGFVTHNTKDFSQPGTNEKTPHQDLGDLFTKRTSRYYTNLVEALHTVNSALVSDLMIEQELWIDPRGAAEVSEAIAELLDKVWYTRHQVLRDSIENGRVRIVEIETDEDRRGKRETCQRDVWEGALKAARKVEKTYGIENLGPWDDFEWGMLNGKLSALRWVLGDDWDFLDT